MGRANFACPSVVFPILGNSILLYPHRRQNQRSKRLRSRFPRRLPRQRLREEGRRKSTSKSNCEGRRSSLLVEGIKHFLCVSGKFLAASFCIRWFFNSGDPAGTFERRSLRRVVKGSPHLIGVLSFCSILRQELEQCRGGIVVHFRTARMVGGRRGGRRGRSLLFGRL